MEENRNLGGIEEKQRFVKTYIRGVTDELAEEDLFVAVKSVDDQAKKLVNLGLEGKGLRISHLYFRHRDADEKRREYGKTNRETQEKSQIERELIRCLFA